MYIHINKLKYQNKEHSKIFLDLNVQFQKFATY
jgi:hypothetical protein